MMLMAVLPEPSRHPGDDVVVTHQAGYFVAATGFALLPQGRMNPWVAISLTTGLVDIYDLFEQGFITHLARAFTAFLPGIISATSDTQLPTQQ